jgi:CheY-like chemotaxis protein
MAEKIGKSVLIVDDEPDIRLFLKTVLENAGFDVSVASNGKEALERMTEEKPDVISLDLVMPKMSGLKFYRYIQKNRDRAGIPVVVVTAHAKDEFGESDLGKIKKAKSEGGTIMVLEKPIQPDVYINTVRRAAGLDELESEDKSEKDVLKVILKEKLKKADKKTLQNVMKLLDPESEGGNKQ